MQLYEYSTNSQGWIFWCWKTEGATEWDFRSIGKNGIMPQPWTTTNMSNGTDTSSASAIASNKMTLLLACY